MTSVSASSRCGRHHHRAAPSHFRNSIAAGSVLLPALHAAVWATCPSPAGPEPHTSRDLGSAWWLTTDAAAAVYEVNISMNDIGVDGARALAAVIPGSALRCIIAGKFCEVKEGASTVTVKQGAFASVAGRFGQVTQDPNGLSNVKLRWLDDGEESKYTKVDKLSSVVAEKLGVPEGGGAELGE
eukprot:COSAG06_NODE_13774_length_1220_cov_32.807315_2_plen_184_part_00